MKNKYEPMTLSTQYADGETTFFAFSDFHHWNNVLSEKNICAVNPSANITALGKS